ncbi:MAG: hypothetical protein LCH76_08380 [Actinobacteria bacterium]|nr:hypothetical protein [Actinomycetota bacterium]
MTTKISPDQAMDALIAARPDTDAIDQSWYIGRREQVLRQVMTSPGSARAATPLRPRRPRWGLVAAAIALVAAAGLFIQVLLPLGAPGSPQAAAALDRLASVVPAKTPIPDGTYELTVYQEAGQAESENGLVSYRNERSTWLASDGWAWVRQTGSDAAYHLFSPIPRNYDLNLVPADPIVMEAYLRARVMGSNSVDEALFVAAQDTLRFDATPAATRAAALRMLAGVPGVTVAENVTDPQGRPATEVRFVDEKNRPGVVQSVFLDPSDAQLLAEVDIVDGVPSYTCVYTERRLVGSLPADVLSWLGTERTPKHFR